MEDEYRVSRREVLGASAVGVTGILAGCMSEEEKSEEEYVEVALPELMVNIDEFQYDDVQTEGHPRYVGTREWYTGCCSATRHTFELYDDPDPDDTAPSLITIDDDDNGIRDVLSEEQLVGGVYEEPVSLRGRVRRWGTDSSFWSGTKDRRYVFVVAAADR